MSLSKFQRMLDGWMTSEGEDICPKHWEKLMNKLGPEFGPMIAEDATPTSEKSIAITRKCLEGWHTDCDREEADGSFCGAVVFVPFGSSKKD